MRLSLLLLSLIFFVAGCQTSALSTFGKIEPGLRKPDVIEAIGSPDHVDRLHGKDRWTYTFYENGIRYQREILFYNGKVTYAGPAQKAKLPADEADKALLTQDEELKQLDQIQKDSAPPKGRDESAYKSEVYLNDNAGSGGGKSK